LLRKSIPIVAWYVLSNVSYMNLRAHLRGQRALAHSRRPAGAGQAEKKGKGAACLVMSDVLPTDWSPSRTIFVRFGGAEEKSAAVGVADSDMVVCQGPRGVRGLEKESSRREAREEGAVLALVDVGWRSSGGRGEGDADDGERKGPPARGASTA
jgi:hypothetical protein